MKKMIKIAMMATALTFSGMASASTSTETLPQDSLAQQLNLTPEQIKTVKALRDEAQKEISKINTDALAQDAIVSMFKSGVWDDSAAKKQLSAIGDIQSQVRYQRAKYVFNVSRVLTAEQKQHLQQLLIEKQLY
ncbi:Spy/CpxP family protein refolding chaperone [Buttiauxella selenatireducens]|uniref:Spy/CpxP family protein refolding chaperone n=1 Tax=Buttiauxella selenatireducens TaxID=3073902 RepID=A0ABY9SAN3_9ENTR|nr:Spy/CpxP family protein refolding chaperone [Buttiauxella sp. R73]WMY74018.1 Spy/CpxP family protein refolding chaperone [Buttiauxella sp. R73]